MKNLTLKIIVVLCLFWNCEADSTTQPSSQGGVGGSMARFTIVDNNLYTVSNTSISWFDISNPKKPAYINQTQIGRNIETIFPYGKNLFIGSSNGLYVYGISANGTPVYNSEIQHFFSCDPVVVDGKYAYVTLSVGNTCRGATTSQLEIVDITDLNKLETIVTYPLTNPKGLAVSGRTLFVCDDGLKAFDITDVHNIKLLAHKQISATDVIVIGANLLVVGPGGFYEYHYSNQDFVLLSKIPVGYDTTK